MTWQRIDEDTYIDDTLVTCMEYQLFIDEMREQGQYYQPDHWISYQFPEGHAREPILGVRCIDATHFCEWLTWREHSVWGYRIPTNIEGENYPTTPKHASIKIGYWIADRNGQFQITWIDMVSDNARLLDVNLALEFIRPLDLTRPFSAVTALKSAIDRARVRPIASEHERVNPGILPSPPALDRTYDLYIAHAKEFDQELKKEFDKVVDLFTIQERIAGRSPAFEGIRLVKERIK